IPSLPPANATMLIRGSISRMYCYESPLTRPAALKNCCHKIGGACSAPHSHPDLQLSRNFLCLQPPCLLFPIPRRGYLIAYNSSHEEHCKRCVTVPSINTRPYPP